VALRPFTPSDVRALRRTTRTSLLGWPSSRWTTTSWRSWSPTPSTSTRTTRRRVLGSGCRRTRSSSSGPWVRTPRTWTSEDRPWAFPKPCEGNAQRPVRAATQRIGPLPLWGGGPPFFVGGKGSDAVVAALSSSVTGVDASAGISPGKDVGGDEPADEPKQVCLPGHPRVLGQHTPDHRPVEEDHADHDDDVDGLAFDDAAQDRVAEVAEDQTAGAHGEAVRRAEQPHAKATDDCHDQCGDQEAAHSAEGDERSQHQERQ